MGEQAGEQTRHGISFSNLEQPLFDDAQATKRELVDYLEAVADCLVPELRDRPLSVVRVRPGQPPFMQKRVPTYAPSWVPTVTGWAESVGREVTYPVCNDTRTLLWFANQRAVEYHPTLVRLADGDHPTYLVIDIDPPEQVETGAASNAFRLGVRAAYLVREVLTGCGLTGAVKTSGSKGLHVCVPLAPEVTTEQAAAATRALAARAERLDPALATTAYLRDERRGRVFLDTSRAYGATVVAAYSPRVRPRLPVSYPVDWDELDRVTPGEFTVATVPGLLGGGDPWARRMPEPQRLPEDLVAEGRSIPVARAQAMHEGKRRARQRRERQQREQAPPE